jgi:hypothetical protein
MIDIDKLTLRQMIKNKDYHSLSDGLIKLPIPDKIRMGKLFDIPKDLESFAGSICYGQKLFLAVKELDDFGIIIRMMDGYYYPIVSGDIWDDDYALEFGREILDCKLTEVYPVANHLIKLLAELIEREVNLLQRQPSQQEISAGIDKLNKFAELTSIKYLQSSLGKTEEQVMLTPYNDCLVEFMLAKEQNDYNERLFKIQHPEIKTT